MLRKGDGGRRRKATARANRNRTNDRTRKRKAGFAQRPKGVRCPICHREFLGDSLKFHVKVSGRGEQGFEMMQKALHPSPPSMQDVGSRELR